MDRVLGNMDTSITSITEEKIQSEGVKLYKGVSVEGFEGKNGVVIKVITDQGIHEADLVLLVIGAKPNTKLAQETGIELGGRRRH
jgi:pyruvate/2-oxoglutarate dehydrogenase complex dihydrolipoamide dehydrogenase (E3) component